MKILAFPKDANPYQELLYTPMRKQGAVVSYLEGPTGSHSLNMLLLPLILTRWRLRGYRLLHVHWTFPFHLAYGGVIGRALMECWAALFWLLAKVYRIRIIWTAHNALPHEPLFLNDRRAHRFLGRQASRVIAHTTAAQQQLEDIDIPTDRIQVIPHGSYIGAYADETTRDVARQNLRLPTAATVFLFFGLIRPYKGIEQLLVAFQTLPTDAAAILVIAGAVQDAGLRDALETAAANDDRIRLQLRYIADDELQLFFHSADFTVLPYERSTTSGVSLLACSFGCPLITPKQAAFADIPAVAQLQYNTGELAGALQQALRVKDSERQQKSHAARVYAEQLSWPNIAAQTMAVYKDAA